MPSNEQHGAEPVSHSLCSAFGMIGSQMTSHQSLVRPLPNADIAEHRVSYTSALLGLCLQSEWGRKRRGWGVESLWTCLPRRKDKEVHLEEGQPQKREALTSKMIPLRTSFESTPTFRSSRHSLSNFSGVSLLSMLQGRKKSARDRGRRKRRRSA